MAKECQPIKLFHKSFLKPWINIKSPLILAFSQREKELSIPIDSLHMIIF